MQKEKLYTALCVTFAGLCFFPAVLFDIVVLFVIGAVFDWLPLFTGWMKIKEKLSKHEVLHIFLTFLAYGFAVCWILAKCAETKLIFKSLFLELWWIAVMLGVYCSRRKK